MTTVEAIIIAVLGSNGLFTLIQYIMNRRSVTRSTVEAVAYYMLSDRIEARLTEGYATPEQRKDVEVLIEAYQKNGWNGDMNARIKRFYDLPTKKIDKE